MTTRPVYIWFGRPVPMFHVLGLAGLAAAIGLSAWLLPRVGLSEWVLVLAAVVSVATFVVVALVTRLLAGQARLTYYHHEIAVLVAVGVVAGVLRQPVCGVLDVVALGIGTFLVFGRLGCLFTGCCHGRPARWGVRYGADHVARGLMPYDSGIPLLPVQLFESALVVLIVGFGAMQLCSGAAVGSTLAWYLLAYDAVRFGIEFLRGDPDRPLLAGFSEAQWTAMVCSLAIGGVGLAGWLPLASWQEVMAAGPLLALIAAAVARRCQPVRRDRLLHPRHVRELAWALRRAALPVRDQATAVAVTSTSLVGLSVGQVSAADGEIRHYTLSGKPGTVVTTTGARLLAKLIARLDDLPGPLEVIAGDGVQHLVASARIRTREAGVQDA